MPMLVSQLRLLVESLSPARPAEHVINREGLLSVEQVPDVLKEPFIFTGYRPVGRPWTYYFCSMLILHNESINVWTHTIGFFVLLIRLLHFFREVNILEEKEAWPVLGFGVCCLLSLTLSAAAHLFHSRSRWHHFLFFLMDYMGVTFYSFGSGIISMFTCSSRGYYDALQGWFLPVNVLLSWFSFFTCCTAITHLSHDNTKRKSLMLVAVSLQGIFVSMPVITRYVECLLSPTCNMESLSHITLVFITICMCGVTFAGHCPESWLPGCFDILGHGHQIFHVLAVIVMLLEVRVIDIEVNVLRTAQELQPDLIHICLAFASLLILEAVTLTYYVHFIFFNRLSQEIPRQDVQESLLNKDETEAEATSCTEDMDVGVRRSAEHMDGDVRRCTEHGDVDVGRCSEHVDVDVRSCTEDMDGDVRRCAEHMDDDVRRCTEHIDDYVRRCTEHMDDYVRRFTEHMDVYVRRCTEDMNDYVRRCTEHMDDYVRRCTEHMDVYVRRCTKHRDDDVRRCTEHMDVYVRRCTEHIDDYVRMCTEHMDGDVRKCTEHMDGDVRKCTEHMNGDIRKCTEHMDGDIRKCTEHMDGDFRKCTEHMDGDVRRCTKHVDSDVRRCTGDVVADVKKFK